jgi:hypothetical protein
MKAIQNDIANNRGGWSYETFRRRFMMLKAQGRIISNGDFDNPQRGDEYSVSYSDRAKAARALYGCKSSTGNGGFEEGIADVVGDGELAAMPSKGLQRDMDLKLPSAVKALINIVIDSGIGIHRRIEAAASLMEVNVPEPVTNVCRKFLLEIAEDKAGFPGHRLAAARAVLKRDLGKYKRARIEPLKWDPLRDVRHVTAEQLIADGIRRTEERDRQLRLVSPAEPEDKAG